MKKEKNLLLVVGLSLMMFCLFCSFSLPVISASMNLRISGTINDQTSDLWLKVKTGATGDVDVYDLKAPTSPSNYSQFASSVAGNSLSIDSWASNPRTLNLTYHMTPSQTGTLNLSWNTDSIDTSLYVVTFRYFGTDLTYKTQVGSDVNMKTSSSYTTTLSGNSDIYIQVNVADYAAPSAAPSAATTSSGGGGGTPSSIPIIGEDIFIGNKFMDVFMILDSKRTRYINLFNQANTPIHVTLDLGDLGNRGVLVVDSEDLSFDLAARTSKTIEVTILSPDELGDYKGNIIVKGIARQEISVDIEVTDQELLFDAEISVPWGKNILGLGSDLPVHVKLTPNPVNPRLDVKANYYVKNEDGNIIHEESKTFIIEGVWEGDLTFPVGTKITKPGEYYVELELEYPWPNPIGVATSKYTFEVRATSMTGGGVLGTLMNYKFVLFIIGIFAFLILLLIIMVVIRHNKIIRRKMKLRR